MKEGINVIDEIRLLRQYTIKKLKELEQTLNFLVKFARDDLKRIDKIEEELRNSHKNKEN